MRRPPRPSLAVAFALLAGALLAWSSLRTASFTDFETEAEPAVDALRHGDIARFLALAPAYGGSLLLRAPFVLAGNVFGGGSLAAFRLLALPALLAATALGLWLWRTLQAEGRPRAAWTALVICSASPLAARGLETGHAEEQLGAVLVAAAALAALRGRAGWCGLLLGLAVVDKPWAVLAVVPVALVLPARRPRAALVAGATAAAGLLPFVLGGSVGVETAKATAQTSGAIFQPWQAWWFLGERDGVVHGLFGEKVGYRVGPGWVATIAHPLVVVVPLLVAAALLSARWHARRPLDPADGLALLALTLLLRCLLDPWNTAYYELPFVAALLVWELHVRSGPPVLTAAALAAASLTLVQLTSVLGPDGQAVAFLAWSVPAAAALGIRVLAPERGARLAAATASALRRRMPGLSRLATSP